MQQATQEVSLGGEGPGGEVLQVDGAAVVVHAEGVVESRGGEGLTGVFEE